MIEINLHNYEAFLLDYFEGNLDNEALIILKNFIQAHPQLEIELEDSSLIRINKVEEQIDFKQNLKKIIEGKDDDLIIAYLENILTKKQKLDFEKRLLTDEYLAAQLKLYRKVILKPMPDDVFYEKKSIFKTEEDLLLNNKHLAYLEGLLSNDDSANYEIELKQNKEIQQAFSTYKKSFLQADFGIQYPNKSELKKEAKIFVLFNNSRIRKMAAAIFLLFLFSILYFVYKPVTNFNKSTIALKSNKTVHPSLNQTTTSVKVAPQAIENLKHEKHLLVSKNQINLKKEILVNQDSLLEIVNPSQLKINQNVSTSVAENDLNPSVSNQSTITKNNVDTLLASRIDLVSKKNFYNINTIEIEKDAEEPIDNSNKNKFWKKLLSIGNKAKNIGIKGIEAEQKENKTYFFAFNNLSIEKK